MALGKHTDAVAYVVIGGLQVLNMDWHLTALRDGTVGLGYCLGAFVFGIGLYCTLDELFDLKFDVYGDVFALFVA